MLCALGHGVLIALASLIIFPDLAAIQTAFPSIDPSIIRDDLAYPAMMTLLPAGAIGFGSSIAYCRFYVHHFISFELGVHLM